MKWLKILKDAWTLFKDLKNARKIAKRDPRVRADRPDDLR